MKKFFQVAFYVSCLCSVGLAPDAQADEILENAKSSTVLIVTFDGNGEVVSRGSGFYVDEGIIISNIHVIDGLGKKYYKIFLLGDDGSIDTECFQEITRSDIRLNLEDDIAYLRAYIGCPHGSVFFADRDPEIGDRIEMLGYPSPKGFYDNFRIERTEGTVLKKDITGVLDQKEFGPWILTDGIIHSGNSGGPVLQNGLVVGIAVAAHIDESGNSTSGIFIPVSIVLKGLEYANDSHFGYTPQVRQKNTVYDQQQEAIAAQNATPFNPIPAAGRIPTDKDCELSLGRGGEATGYGPQQGDGCRCKSSFHKDELETMCLPGSPEYVAEIYAAQKQQRERRRAAEAARQNSESAQEEMQNEDEGVEEEQIPKVSFSDVRETNRYNKQISGLVERGVLSGYPDGTFRGENTINRAELIKILIEGLHPQESKEESHCFPDVEDEWFATHVCAAKRLGWIGGYPDGTFRPAQTVNRAEAIKIIISSLTSTFNSRAVVPRDVPTDSWYAKFVRIALERGILTGTSTFNPQGKLNRFTTSEWIFNAITEL